jgi:hypothetical protein
MLGRTGAIRFDSYGDLIGTVEVFQYQKVYGETSYAAIRVGSSINIDSGFSALNMTLLDWTVFRKNDSLSSVASMPESSCGHQCKVGEYAAQLPIVCCWECKPCPKNGDVGVRFFFLYAIIGKTIARPRCREKKFDVCCITASSKLSQLLCTITKVLKMACWGPEIWEFVALS